MRRRSMESPRSVKTCFAECKNEDALRSMMLSCRRLVTWRLNSYLCYFGVPYYKYSIFLICGSLTPDSRPSTMYQENPSSRRSIRARQAAFAEVTAADCARDFEAEWGLGFRVYIKPDLLKPQTGFTTQDLRLALQGVVRASYR